MRTNGKMKRKDERKRRRGREMGEFGPPLRVLVSPVSSTGPQQTTERERGGCGGNTGGSG